MRRQRSAGPWAAAAACSGVNTHEHNSEPLTSFGDAVGQAGAACEAAAAQRRVVHLRLRLEGWSQGCLPEPATSALVAGPHPC